MNMDRKELGKYGEEQAVNLLRAKGYRILDTNWKCRAGELDIVAQKGYIITFAEVKTRRTLEFGTPSEAITAKKKTHIRNTAAFYMKSHNINDINVRFDVIEIYVNHIERAF
ncbi:MAG: YraN family protein [Eubacteriaceae bacterium]|nr:YraN family protein [Eubacteriaceae bacterium]